MRKACLLLLTFLSSCTNPFIAFQPDAYAPQSTWTAYNQSKLITSKYCDILLPKNFETDKMSLGEMIDIALHNNPDTQISWAEAKSKAANFSQSMSTYYPEVSASISYTRQRESLPLSTNVVTDFFITNIDPELNLSYTVFDFGERRNTTEAAKQALLNADWSHNREIQTVIRQIMEDYYDYLYQLEKKKAYEEDLETAGITLDSARKRLSSGVDDLSDVSKAKTKFLQAKINLIGQKRTVEKSFTTLAKDAGLPANLNFDVQGLPEEVFVSAIMESVEELIEKAQSQRQDFLAAAALVNKAEAELNVAKSQYYPTLTSKANIGKNWYNTVDNDGYHWSFTFNLDIPIFRGNYYVNGVRKAKIDLKKTTARLLQKELQIIEEVTISRLDVDAAADALKCTEEYLKEAAQQYDIALKYYEQGVNTIVDVLNAESNLADARAKLAKAKKHWFTSLANLAYSTGILCNAPETAKNCKL